MQQTLRDHADCSASQGKAMVKVKCLQIDWGGHIQWQEDLCEFEAGPVYRASSWSSRVT